MKTGRDLGVSGFDGEERAMAIDYVKRPRAAAGGRRSGWRRSRRGRRGW
ncbi:hypothetical protein NKH77_32545 [Streptomyces sp. M19]